MNTKEAIDYLMNERDITVLGHSKVSWGNKPQSIKTDTMYAFYRMSRNRKYPIEPMCMGVGAKDIVKYAGLMHRLLRGDW